jgi:hypothetical protein
MTYASWHYAVETPSSLPAAPPLLEQRVDLELCLVPLGRHGLRKPSEQSRHRGYVLASPGEVWESVIILDDSPMCIAGKRAHLIMVLCNLMLECCALLL